MANSIPPLLYQFFHNETNNTSETNPAKKVLGKSEWPDEWKTIDYKKYGLHPAVPLTRVVTPLKAILSSRRSSEGYILENKLTLPLLSHILQCGYGLQEEVTEKNRSETRMVPSAGQRYPLEVYLILFQDVEDCRAGIYHYSVREHVLEPLTFDTFTESDIRAFTPIDWLTKTKAMICFTGIFNRTTDKYGNRGYRYILLEAGHVAQNMILAGTERGVNIIPIGASREEVIEKRLCIGSLSERVVYTLFL